MTEIIVIKNLDSESGGNTARGLYSPNSSLNCFTLPGFQSSKINLKAQSYCWFLSSFEFDLKQELGHTSTDQRCIKLT